MQSLKSILLALVALIQFQGEAAAQVRHNAGRSDYGGMGLDIAWWCKDVTGRSDARVEIVGNGWNCFYTDFWTGNKISRRVDEQDACHRHYGNTSTAYLGSGGTANDWYCVLGLNIEWYCRNLYGPNAKAVNPVDMDRVYWSCESDGEIKGLDMYAACRSHYGSSAVARLGFPLDRHVWHCQL